MAASRICKIEGCGKPTVGRGWCRTHYQRWWKSGDPLALLQSSPYGKDVPLIADRLRELLDYDPGTGILTWRIRTGGYRGDASFNANLAGTEAGTPRKDGYRMIIVDGRSYLSHRLAWLHVHGRWPDDELDHKNGVRDDNRLTNLRECTHAENSQNCGIRANNSVGLAGVTWNKREKKYVSRLVKNGTKYHLGYFDDPSEAHAAYIEKKRELHDFEPELRST